jgi:primosomal protein N' (replication factor Y)
MVIEIKKIDSPFYYRISIIGSPLEPLTYISDKKIAPGTFVKVPLRKKTHQGIVVSECESADFKCKEVIEITPFYLPLNYQKIAKFISKYYLCSYAQALSLFVPFNKSSTINHQPSTINHPPSTIHLSPEQQKAYDFILTHQTSLLFGDTGSGKTEVYMKLFEKYLKEGKSALFLMPEIGLTPQMEKRLKDKFGDLAAIWHSKLTKKQRAELTEQLYDSKIKIIAGPRSALFLPLKEIGIIVVDEEHDDSYKAGNRPRYNARDIAVYFGKILGAKVVLGSATPSLNSYVKYPNFRLKGGFFESKKDFIFEKEDEKITPFILDQISKTFHKGRQSIIFLPTRANFKYLSCTSCGKTVICPSCSVGMSLHKDKRALVCHYCNYTRAIPNLCEECKEGVLKTTRIGTAEVAMMIENEFKQMRVERFDKDKITTQNKLKKILKDFNENKIDLLIGTQMLSKGHDYHDIDLAVVIGIDHILHQADFRAREKALSLLFQIAGRSGRKRKGKVIVQTNNSEFFKKYLKDYELFLKDELIYRKNLYPPFVKLMRFIVSHKQESKAQASLQKLHSCITKHLQSLKPQQTIEIVGTGAAPIEKMANRYRYHLLLRSPSAKALLQTALKCKCTLCEIDIDPVNFS